MASEAHTIITFLKRCKKFAHDNTITSSLIVEGETTVDDLEHVLGVKCGMLIAGIQNDVSEIKSKLEKYYESEGNKKMLEKLKKI